MILDDWIKKYEKKAEPFSIPSGFVLWFEPNKGFFLYAKNGDYLEIDATCTTDIKAIMAVANAKAKIYGCRFLRTQTHRDPIAYMRLTGATPDFGLSGHRDNGLMYWVFWKEVV